MSRWADVLRLAVLAVVSFHAVGAQQAPTSKPVSTILRLERELWTRLADRARRAGALTTETGEFDLAIPIVGEPTEVLGPTRSANASLGVASARLEPLDFVGTRLDVFRRGRYDLRLEDRLGRCLLVHLTLVFDTAATRTGRTTERCEPLYMADVVRRSKRLAHVPLTAGEPDANWSVALFATGFADVYLDSVVVTTTALTLRANSPQPDTASVAIDSIRVGVARGEDSWNIVRASEAVPVDTVLRRGGEWVRGALRLTIPIDSGFALRDSWPVFEVILSVPRTPDNPLGLAWTYAHGPHGFFSPRKP